MPITITNNTAFPLELWDAGTLLITIPAGVHVGALPITISSITYRNVSYQRRIGGFVQGSNYGAVFKAAAPPDSARIVFTASPGGVVQFA